MHSNKKVVNYKVS